MAVSRNRSNWLLPFIVAVMASGLVFNVFAAEGDFADIWKEGPEGPPRQVELSPERLEQVIKYVASDNAERQKQLKELYESDRDKFWGEIRKFFRKQRSENGNSGGPGRGGPRWREHLQRQHDEFLAWLKLKDNFPEVEKELSALRDKDPEAYLKKFAHAREDYWHIWETEKRNPELAKVLKEEVRLTHYRDSLLKEIRRAGRDRKRRQRLIDDLKKVVAKRFELIVLKKQFQFDELHERLEKLRKELEQREQQLKNLVDSKEETVKNRVRQLLYPKPRDDGNKGGVK